MYNTFFDIYVKQNGNPTFCYRSGNMVYEEMFYNGALITCGYNAAGYPLDVLSNFPTHLDRRYYTEPFAFNIEADGQSIDYDLSFVDFTVEKSPECIHSVLVLDSKIKPIRLKVHTVLDGTQMFTRYFDIENLSETPINISRLSLISGGIEDMDTERLSIGVGEDELYSVGYFADDRWGREGEFCWKPLRTEVTSIYTRFNRDRFRHPLVFVRNNLLGKIWFAQIGWSGGCRFTLDNNAKAENASSHLSFKAEILAHNPMYVLDGYETFTTPEVYMGLVHGDIDDAVYHMHEHIRRSVIKTECSSLLVGAGMGAEHDMSVETSKIFIDQLAQMGAEVFIVDAGWACPPGKETHWGEHNGINIPDGDRYPNGIGEVVDYCHEKGIKFGLWVDIDLIGELSPMYAERPEWRAVNAFGEQSSSFADYSHKELEKRMENDLARIITEYRLDLLRVDCNVDYKDYFGMRDTGAGRKECTSIKHFNAVYRIFRNLKERFPNVIFENCAGGGGRTDLGMMKAFNHTWVSDCQCAPHSLYITNGMTMALPPERVDRLFAGMGCHSFGSFDLQMRNTMLTHMSLNVVASAAASLNPLQIEFVKHSTDVYKQFIRPIIPFSKVCHHTPDSFDALNKGFTALEIYLPDKTKGAAAVFSLPQCNNGNINIKLKGIDASRTYKVTLDNDRVTYVCNGATLCAGGISVNLPSSLMSELVLFEAVG